MGLLHFFLGLENWQHDQGIFVSHQRYVQELLATFNMVDARPISLPMDVNKKFLESCDSPLADAHLYWKFIGSLIWLLNTWCDINFRVSLLASFMGSPLQTHWHAGLCILRYLKSTPDLGILYTADHDISQAIALFGWTILDWAGNVDSCRSTIGYSITLGLGAISWSSKKKPTVALSSTEAEYKAACFGTCKVVWLCFLLKDLGFSQQSLSLVLCDN